MGIKESKSGRKVRVNNKTRQNNKAGGWGRRSLMVNIQ